MKIMAVLNALRSPAFQAELGIAPSTGSSSPRDSETGFHMGSETGSISSSMTGGSDDHHQDMGMPPPPPPPTWSQSGHAPENVPRDYHVSFNGFSLGAPVFPSPQKPTFPNSNSIADSVHNKCSALNTFILE